MPRIVSSRIVRHYNALLPYWGSLVPVCGGIELARSELRWLRNGGGDWRQRCQRRIQGWPLQYILGSQPFGPLEIRVRPGVLVPRWETEEYSVHLGLHLPQGTSILDLCSGTGCISLLLASMLRGASVTGIDASSIAVALARRNLSAHTDLMSSTVGFQQADIFEWEPHGHYAYIVANPPYISADRPLDRSVRFEPRHALIGKNQGDEFYPRVLAISQQAHARGVFMEIGDTEQAHRVASMAEGLGWQSRVWKDSANRDRLVYAFKSVPLIPTPHSSSILFLYRTTLSTSITSSVVARHG